MSKRFLLILVALVVAFAGVIWYSKNKESKQNATTPSAVTNHTKGAGNKKVTFIEYGDFECNACGAYYPIIEEVVAKYGDDITFQFRHFPIVQLHQNAMAAHRAAEAAARQDKFWEMYNVLYSQQTSWDKSTSASKIFEGYAQQLGLNMEQYRTDVQSSQVNDAINADVKAGQALGVNSTPTFVINGKKIDLPERSPEAFMKLIDEAIKNAGSSSSSNQ